MHTLHAYFLPLAFYPLANSYAIPAKARDILHRSAGLFDLTMAILAVFAF